MFIAKVVMALVANASAQSLFLKELSDAPLDRNEQPVIGILSQTLEDYMKTTPSMKDTSHIS